METTKLGNSDLIISRLGLGCMGMSEFYGPSSDAASTKLIHQAIDRGITFFDTADMYGRGANERLVGTALKSQREQVVLATKFGVVRSDDPNARGINGHPDYIRQACDASLQRLGVDYIDLYYQHRIDPTVPIEDSIGAMKDLVEEGKVKAIGICEASPKTIRRAHAIHPLSALQSEYSLWTRDPEKETLSTCRELGITFVAYSPLGRGFLSGKIQDTDQLDTSDFRRTNPRFQGENFDRNRALLSAFTDIASKLSIQPAQLALAWVLSQRKDIVAIPGTRRLQYLKQNISSLDIELDRSTIAELDHLFPIGSASGDRYPSQSMSALNG